MNTQLFNARQDWLAAKRECEAAWARYVVAILKAETMLRFQEKVKRQKGLPGLLKMQGG